MKKEITLKRLIYYLNTWQKKVYRRDE